MKRYLLKYQISLPTCFYHCSTELQFFTVVGMLSRDALPMDIGAKYFDGNSCLLQKAPQVFGRKTYHIRQFEKVYGMRTIIPRGGGGGGGHFHSKVIGMLVVLFRV